MALALAALALPARAAAAVTVGQLPSAPPPATCQGGFDFLEPTVTGGTLYVAREAGTITSWSTNAATSGATYTFKVLRRTADPDVFQVIAHTSAHTLDFGVNSVAADVQVQSGDLIGFRETGPMNSCTFPLPGDTVLLTPTDLADGDTTAFASLSDARLNLAANLVPSNSFTFAGLTRNRRRGTATLTVTTPNPGTVALAGRGLKKARSKTVAVPGSLIFPIAATGKLGHRLGRKGKATLVVNATFTPTGGDPSTQTVAVQLKQRRQAPAAG
jgi:hypothetical protein